MIERSKSMFDETLKFVSENSRGDVVNPKLDKKGSKLVFHIPMLIGR